MNNRSRLFRGKVIHAPAGCVGTYTGGQFVHGSLLIWPSGEHEICVSTGDTDMDKLTVNRNTVGQFTGMNDKNGNPIYEGDIVKNWQGGWNVVVYKAPSFEATVSADQSSMYRLDWWEQTEVVGNVYDNPELLK